MENGSVEQGVADETDLSGSELDAHPTDDGSANGAVEGDAAVSEDGSQFDANSPEARFWQSVADKRVGKLETELNKIKAQVAGGRIREGGEQSQATPSMDEILGFGTYQPPRLPPGELADMGFDDRTLEALDKRVQALVQHGAAHFVQSISASNQRAAQQAQHQTASQKLEAFVGEHGDHGAKILALYDANPEMATRNTDEFIEFAKFKLGIASGQAQQPPRRGLASAVQNSTTRPTRNGTAAAKVAKPASIRDGIAAAVDDYLKRRGG